MRRPNILSAALLPLLLAPFSAGCVSETQMRLAVQDRDREIAVLRGEKMELQERVDILSLRNNELSAQVATVGTQPASAPVESDTDTTGGGYVTFPELDEAGVTYGSRGGNIVFSMPAEITFASGKAALSTRGRVWSFTNSCYAPPTPYVVTTDPFEPITIAAVELEDEKMVVMGQVEGASVADLEAGMEMEITTAVLNEDDENQYIVWRWQKAS